MEPPLHPPQLLHHLGRSRQQLPLFWPSSGPKDKVRSLCPKQQKWLSWRGRPLLLEPSKQHLPHQRHRQVMLWLLLQWRLLLLQLQRPRL